MKPRPEHLQLLVRNAAEQAVSADAALAFVKSTRRRGGSLALIATGLSFSVMMVCLATMAVQPLMLLVAAAAAVPFGVLMKRGLRTPMTAQALADAARLPAPLSAVLADRVLLLGTTGSPPYQWCAVPVTDPEARHIRTLALPGAYIPRR